MLNKSEDCLMLQSSIPSVTFKKMAECAICWAEIIKWSILALPKVTELRNKETKI